MNEAEPRISRIDTDVARNGWANHLTMRIHVLSDLHLVASDFVPPETGADAVVLAGNIGISESALHWAAKTFAGQTVIYVLGEYEILNKTGEKLDRLKFLGQSLGLHILDKECFQIEGVRFLGATMETNLNWLPSKQFVWRNPGSSFIKVAQAKGWRQGRDRSRRLEHQRIVETLKWLRNAVSEEKKHTVIVTSGAPTARSLPEQFRDEWLSHEYAVERDELIAACGVPLWIHGQTYYNVDYKFGATRVVSNQRGYPSDPAPGFRPALVIEV